MKVNVNVVNAFVEGEIGGNPAGVVLNADNLSTAQRLKIARKIGLSETAFVSTSAVADFKLDFLPLAVKLLIVDMQQSRHLIF